jgi:diaminohydroxyphosphoribosylaminopyrimidine deaminase/5-amino-6-(5-phosphoribosylamino)uracil reductase
MDLLYMQRCLDLARLGAGSVAPNPLVGSVLVYQDKIIGEGWHHAFGQAHAEVNAIASIKDKELLSKATLYVNLEPCAHYGKTPPCAALIVEKGIKKVVLGMRDPNPLVAGKGIEYLKANGVEVIENVMAMECLALNKRFIKGITQHKSYVILKWAQTANGYIAPDATAMSKKEFEEKRHITGLLVQKLVHKWRTQEDAIMVATNTALLDNPALNNRAFEGRAPARIVLDQHLRLPLSLKVFDGTLTTYVLNAVKQEECEHVKYFKLDFAQDWFNEALSVLHAHGIQSVVVEGGAQLLNHIIGLKAWDEAIVFYSKSELQHGVVAPLIGGKIRQQESLGQVNMIQYFPS